MPAQQIARFLEASGLPPEEAALFAPLWRRRLSLKRHDFLTRKGQTEAYMYLVKEGALRLFYPVDDEEICVGFAYENTLVSSFPSFIANKPSEYSIQALRQCELVGVSRADFVQLMEQRPLLERYWRIQIEKAMLGRINREIDLLLPSPDDRLQRLLARSPHIFQLIPRKYLASYLRMTPETLSRIKLKD